MIKLNIINNGIVRFPFDENKPYIEVTEEEFAKIQNGDLKVVNGKLINNHTSKLAQERIKELKKLLSSTDYKAIKYAEGELTASEYEPIKQQRKAWREEINELEEQLGA